MYTIATNTKKNTKGTCFTTLALVRKFPLIKSIRGRSFLPDFLGELAADEVDTSSIISF